MSAKGDANQLARVSGGRRVGLDALRGVAALGVLLYHYRWWVPIGWDTFDVLSYGSRGVALFFMLSGYAIAGAAQRSESAVRFIVARAWRLYPVYWCGVCIAVAANSVSALALQMTSDDGSEIVVAAPVGGSIAERPSDVVSWVANLSMLQQVLGIPGVSGVYWTLFIEMQWYGLVAILIRLGLARCVWSVSAAAAVVWAGVVAFDLRDVIPGLWRIDVSLPWIYHSHWFALGAVVNEWEQRPRVGGMLVAGCVVVGFAGTERTEWAINVVLTVLFIAAVAYRARPFLADASACGQPRKECPRTSVLLARGRACVINAWGAVGGAALWLGAVSYPLYLAHEPVGYCVFACLLGPSQSGCIAVLIACGVSLVVAWGVHCWIEVPVQNLARRSA